MSRSSKGELIFRVIRTLMFFQEPHTVGELAEEIGIGMHGASFYIPMLKKAGLPVMSRTRPVPGYGQNPIEYWINYNGVIFLEASRLICQLRGK